MILAHRIRLYPNRQQETYFRRACGIRRFAYNWALETSASLHAEGIHASDYDLVRRFNGIKAIEFPWTSEVTKWAPQKAIMDAFGALKHWWKKEARHPKFKKRGKCRESFYLGVGHFGIKDTRFRIPKLGWVKMSQPLRFLGTAKFATISQDGDRWFASVSVELPETYVYPHGCETQAVVGIDLGIKGLATLDDGTKIVNPRWLLQREVKVRHLHRCLSRTIKGSKRRDYARLRLANAYRKVRDARSDFTHKMTTAWVKAYRWIGIEDLNVRGMMANHKLAKHIGDANFGEIRRQLGYKGKMAGSNLVIVDRWFPSSRLCSVCGWKNEGLTLADRSWECPKCGVLHDRDRNAAENLAAVARRHRDTLNARGGDVRPVGAKGSLSAAPVNRESHDLLTKDALVQVGNA